MGCGRGRLAAWPYAAEVWACMKLEAMMAGVVGEGGDCAGDPSREARSGLAGCEEADEDSGGL